MSKESKLLGAAVGVSAGIFVWVVGLDKSLWPSHPEFFLVAVSLLVGAVSLVIIQRGEPRSPEHAKKVS